MGRNNTGTYYYLGRVTNVDGAPIPGAVLDVWSGDGDGKYDMQYPEPAMKGQTASSSYKPAKLSNGARAMVPPHISPGTRIVIQTEDGSYVERAKD